LLTATGQWKCKKKRGELEEGEWHMKMKRETCGNGTNKMEIGRGTRKAEEGKKFLGMKRT
jgi:hypothetical protein